MLNIIFLISILSEYQTRRAIDQKFNSYIPRNGRDPELEALRQIFSYNDEEKRDDFYNVSDKSKSPNYHPFISDYLPSSDPKKRKNLRLKKLSKLEEIQSNDKGEEEHDELKDKTQQEQQDESNDKGEKEEQNELKNQTEQKEQLEKENERTEQNEESEEKRSFNQLGPSSNLKTDQHDTIKDKSDVKDHISDTYDKKQAKKTSNQGIESANDPKKTLKNKNLISSSSNESTCSQRHIISKKKPNLNENQTKKDKFNSASKSSANEPSESVSNDTKKISNDKSAKAKSVRKKNNLNHIQNLDGMKNGNLSKKPVRRNESNKKQYHSRTRVDQSKRNKSHSPSKIPYNEEDLPNNSASPDNQIYIHQDDQVISEEITDSEERIQEKIFFNPFKVNVSVIFFIPLTLFISMLVYNFVSK